MAREGLSADQRPACQRHAQLSVAPSLARSDHADLLALFSFSIAGGAVQSMLLFRSLAPILRRRQFKRREQRRIGQRVMPTKTATGISISTATEIAYDTDDASLDSPMALDHIVRRSS